MSSPSKLQDHQQLIAFLATIDFADRYYVLCRKFETSGPGWPVEEQRALVDALGRGFVYDKREKFFGCRAQASPEGIELGLNINLRDGVVEFILVCATTSGHIGGTFAGLALDVKRLGAPAYKHSPAYPRPKYASKEQAADILAAGLELYDAIRAVVVRSLG